MININQIVEVKWAISNKKHFESLSYEFTKYKDVVKVQAKDLPRGSDVKVVVVCDYCEEDIIKSYRGYNKQVDSSNAYENTHKDCCRKCTPLKTKEFSGNKIAVTKDVELLIVKDYEAGMSYLDIRRKHKISEGVLYSIKERYGVENKTNSWSDGQIELLKEFYPTGDWNVILKELHPFDKQDIHTKAHKLGVSSADFHWSDEDNQLLLEIYEEKSFDELVEIFPNRTAEAIQTRASRMGIRKKTKWTQNELIKLKAMYEDYPNEMLIEFFPDRNTSSITDMAGALNLKKSKKAAEKYKEKVSTILIEKLQEFSVSLGKTPTSLDINNNPNMPGILTYHRHFETYSNACEAAGLEVNPSMFRRSYHLKSINGDICLSEKERLITNLLIYQGIGFQKEVMYKDIINEYDEKMIRCDWLIGNNVVVEYFGMPEKEDYRIRMNEKIELCKTHGVQLIALYSEDISNNFKGLKSKFNDFDIQIT